MNEQQQSSKAGEAIDDVFGDSAFLDDYDPFADVQEHLNKQSEATFPEVKRSKPNPPHEPTSLWTSENTNTTVTNEALERTLETYFGYSKYRDSQLDVIKTLLDKRDCAVFWPTGHGKSLCYTIPALHSVGKVTIVITPLISLMQDQVHKLGGLSDRPLATFVGSAQTDPQIKQQALQQGIFPLVYMTPEFFNTDYCQSQLERLANAQKLILVAVDEAHCVSEWGHDFRPDYRRVGERLRGNQALASIPVVALTATATERVQNDIIASLRLRNPHVVKLSFDRPNLRIQIKKKHPSAGTVGVLIPLLPRLFGRDSSGSTVVYAPTRALVEEVSTVLKSHNKTNGRVEVHSYHGGMSSDLRDRAHKAFLTSQSSIIVGTVAFGMGIDKPDIRRVIHFAPPKTVEEYYQQIGRAGRDGLAAECIMYCNEPDFDRYKSDFYLRGLHSVAKDAVLNSLAALRKFSFSSGTCRRRSLLRYFGEEAPFGEHCGNCDICNARSQYGTDAVRDMSQQARIVLLAVEALSSQGISTIMSVIGENIVDKYRYNKYVKPERIQNSIRKLRAKLPEDLPVQYFRELVVPLCENGFLAEKGMSGVVGGQRRNWTVYSLTSRGMQVLKDKTKTISLPVPDYVRRMEALEKERRERVLQELEAKGLPRDKIPTEELEKGDGEVIRSYSKWYNYVERTRRGGHLDRTVALEALFSRIEVWRSEVAVKQLVAPSVVLPEHLLASLAYATATLPTGSKMDKSSIIAVGVRTREVDSLVDALATWVDEMNPPSGTLLTKESSVASMVVGQTKPSRKWDFAVYRPQKKTGMACWESSYHRFSRGESPQAIALTPTGKKPIQMNTVVSHILEALEHGHTVDLGRLSQSSIPPNQDEWEQLVAAESSTGMNVCGDPGTSGRLGARFFMKDFLRPILGDCVELPYEERSDSDRAKFSLWCQHLRWYMALRRSGHNPSFSRA